MGVDGIVAEAGVSRGTFSRYHDDVAELMARAAVELGAEVVECLAPQVDRQAGSPERLTVGMIGVLELLRTNPVLAAVITHAGWPMVTFPAEHPLIRRVLTNLTEGHQDGEFSLDPEAALTLTLAAVVGAAHLVHTATPPTDADLVSAYLRLLGVDGRRIPALVALTPQFPEVPATSLLLRLPRAD